MSKAIHIMRRAPLIIFVSLILLFSLAAPAFRALAQDDDVQEPLKVVTKDIEPFVFVDGTEVTGFSVDLWQALALELRLPYEFEIVTTVQEQLAAVEANEADVAIAAISITEEREATVDFTHRYYTSGLGILTKPESNTPLLDSFRAAISPTMLRLLAFLVLSILIAAHVIWLIERERNPEFPRTYLKGIWEGLWWAAVTVTTVGYGDKTPIGRAGRLFGMLWMFAGLFIIANFTAGVTSQLTLQRIEGTINGPEDLRGKAVVAVAGSTADEWLKNEGIAHRTVEVIDDAYSMLDSGISQAVVYDHPVLLYYALQSEDGDYIVPGPAFNREDYGIALPAGSPLREDINRALLKLIEEGTYQQIHTRWYGTIPNP